jgi:hypothetical protein
VGRWKAGGYLIEQHKSDHSPVHVHVSRDDVLLARVCIPSGNFLGGYSKRHAGRILKALARST